MGSLRSGKGGEPFTDHTSPNNDNKKAKVGVFLGSPSRVPCLGFITNDLKQRLKTSHLISPRPEVRNSGAGLSGSRPRRRLQSGSRRRPDWGGGPSSQPAHTESAGGLRSSPPGSLPGAAWAPQHAAAGPQAELSGRERRQLHDLISGRVPHALGVRSASPGSLHSRGVRPHPRRRGMSRIRGHLLKPRQTGCLE